MRKKSERFREESAVIVGQHRGSIWHGRLRQPQVGSAASVEFDWAWVIRREERQGDVIGFYHTHPRGLTAPSDRDVRTMRAWVTCLGKPLLCLIRSGNALAGYIFLREGGADRNELLAEVQEFPREVMVGVDNPGADAEEN